MEELTLANLKRVFLQDYAVYSRLSKKKAIPLGEYSNLTFQQLNKNTTVELAKMTAKVMEKHEKVSHTRLKARVESTDSASVKNNLISKPALASESDSCGDVAAMRYLDTQVPTELKNSQPIELSESFGKMCEKEQENETRNISELSSTIEETQEDFLDIDCDYDEILLHLGDPTIAVCEERARSPQTLIQFNKETRTEKCNFIISNHIRPDGTSERRVTKTTSDLNCIADNTDSEAITDATNVNDVQHPPLANRTDVMQSFFSVKNYSNIKKTLREQQKQHHEDNIQQQPLHQPKISSMVSPGIIPKPAKNSELSSLLDLPLISRPDDAVVVINDEKLFKLFGAPCEYFLNDTTCRNSAGCRFSHRLIEPYKLKDKMVIVRTETAMQLVYGFLCRSKKLFLTYFQMLCDLCGEKNYRNMLLATLKDLARPELDELRCFFTNYVLQALVATGLQRPTAIQAILVNCVNFDMVNSVVKIILESKLEVYSINELQNISRIPNYEFSIPAIKRMAEICIETQVWDLIEIVRTNLARIEKDPGMERFCHLPAIKNFREMLNKQGIQVARKIFEETLRKLPKA